jgi:hypothetical protein
MKKIVSCIFILALLISCDSFRIEKRKYMKGYYVGSSKTKHNSTASHNEDTQTFLAEKNAEEDSFTDLSVSIKPEPIQLKKEKLFAETNDNYSDKKNNIIGIKPQIRTEEKSNPASDKLKQKISKKEKKPIGWEWLVLIAGITGVVFTYSFKYQKSGLMSIQSWAYQNKLKARSIMFLAKAAFVFGGFWLGVKLFEQNYLFPSYSSFALSAAYLLGLLIYPFKKSSLKTAFAFSRKKFSGLVMSISGLLLCMNLGNHVASENANGININQHLNKRCADYFETKKTTPDNINSTNDVEAPSKIFADDDDTATYALKLVLNILAIISIVALEVIIIVLGCLMACDGAEGAAIAIIFFGTVLLAALSVVTLYWISRIKLNRNSSEVK